MYYALLIYQAEELLENTPPEKIDELLAAHRKLQEKTKANGAFVLANQLTRSHAATTVRERSGEFSVTDGPFAETKEQLVGLYVMECDTLDEAIAYAKEIPHVSMGSIEIRPIGHFEVRPPS